MSQMDHRDARSSCFTYTKVGAHSDKLATAVGQTNFRTLATVNVPWRHFSELTVWEKLLVLESAQFPRNTHVDGSVCVKNEYDLISHCDSAPNYDRQTATHRRWATSYIALAKGCAIKNDILLACCTLAVIDNCLAELLSREQTIKVGLFFPL